MNYLSMLCATDFEANAIILYVIVALIILVVLGQSFYFLIRAYKRAKEKGMDMSKINKTISSAAIFTIAPAVSILIGVIVLSKSLGVPFSWLRLSVIGSLSYETTAAASALDALGKSLSELITDPDVFVTITWIMTIGIILSLVLTPILTKKIQGGLKTMEKKDKKWTEILNNAMFVGMISAFLGFVFGDVYLIFEGNTSGLTPVCVMAVSALTMCLCGLLSSKFKIKWITDYAVPFSLIVGMLSAIPISSLLGAWAG